MIEITLERDSATIISDNCSADFDTLQQIEEHHAHLINFDEVTKALNSTIGANKFYFHAKTFKDVIMNLWINDFSLIIPTFDSMYDELYYNRLKNQRRKLNDRSYVVRAVRLKEDD